MNMPDHMEALIQQALLNADNLPAGLKEKMLQDRKETYKYDTDPDTGLCWYGVPPNLRADLKEEFLSCDDFSPLYAMNNQFHMIFMWNNLEILKKSGHYETLLFDAATLARDNHSHIPLKQIKATMNAADRERLLSLGDEAPHDGPFVVYRGISGHGEKRRKRGIAWTASYQTAKWFACRFGLEKPSVLRAEVPLENVYFFDIWGRNELEVCCDIPKDMELKEVWRGKNGALKPNREEAFFPMKSITHMWN